MEDKRTNDLSPGEASRAVAEKRANAALKILHSCIQGSFEFTHLKHVNQITKHCPLYLRRLESEEDLPQ